MRVGQMLFVALLRRRVLTISTVFATVLIVGFASIQDGEGVISAKEQNI